MQENATGYAHIELLLFEHNNATNLILKSKK